MKKVSLYFIGLALIGMTLISCQKDEYAGDTIRATIEKGSPKTHLSGTNNIDNRWDNSPDLDPEQIMVVYPTFTPTYNTSGNNNDVDVRARAVKYTAIAISDDKHEAEFAHAESENVDFASADAMNGKIELYYPASSLVNPTKYGPTVGGHPTAFIEVPTSTVDVSSNGQYSDYKTPVRKIWLNYIQNKNNQYRHDTRDWPMYGYVTSTTTNDCRVATFYNLCGGLRLQLKSGSTNAAITKITVWTDNKALVGEMQLSEIASTSDYEGNLAASTSHLCAMTYDATNESANKRTIVYQPANDIVALNATTATDFDICMPCGDYDNLYIRFEGVDGQYCVKQLTADQLRIRRDELRVIEFNLNFTPPEGAVLAYYSVSPTKSVYFAQGNLRYYGSNETHNGIWRFADNQYDMLVSVQDLNDERTGAFGRTGTSVRVGNTWRHTPYYDGRIRHWQDGNGTVHEGTEWRYGARTTDHNQHSYYSGGTRHTYYNNNTHDVWELFGWSSGTMDHYGVSTKYDNDDYYNGGFVDWGTLPIVNGGNQPHQWRTLYGGTYTVGKDNYGEWDYLLNHRIADNKIVYNLPPEYVNNPNYNLNNQSKACWAIVRVNGIPGILLFPDRFVWPSSLGVDRIPRYLNMNPNNWTDNNVINYTYDEFAILEDVEYQATSGCGCAFLPAAGSRGGASTEQICFLLRYWLNSQPDQISQSANGDKTGAYYIGLTEDDDDCRDGVPADSAHNLYWGRAVRLAMDAVPWDTRGTNNPWLEKGSNGSKGVATKAKAILRKRY